MIDQNIKLSILIQEIDNEQRFDNNKMLINTMSLPKKMSDAEKKAWVLNNFIDPTEQTIIYCNEPRRCTEAIDAILKI